MWKWISRRCKGEGVGWCENEVGGLKVKWLASHGIKEGEINQDCFFCHKSGANVYICSQCPAKKIDPSFNCIESIYTFDEYPRLFYAELKRLNKIRLAKKK
jgi:hypothetical protein